MSKQVKHDQWHDKDYLKSLSKEWDKGESRHFTVRLPCGHCQVELTDPRDALIACPVCGKKALIAWSATKQEIQWER